MKTLFGGLFLETAGLVWDAYRHLSGFAKGEGLIAPSHMVIFIGFAISFLGAVLVYNKFRKLM